mgnify:CR=1 FL=1
MKQIGNLAIVCARRKDVTLRIEQGRVMVMLDGTYASTAFSANWDDDETILSVIHELNFGHCAPKKPNEKPRSGRKRPFSSTSCES